MFDVSHWPWWKSKCSNLSDDGTEPWRVCKAEQFKFNNCPFLFAKIWMFHEQTYHFLLDRHALASWAIVWILLHTDAVDLVCSAFIFISTFFPRQCCKHVSHSLHRSLSLFLTLSFQSFCAVKGQTETGVHCEVIPVKCLLCLCNWCHPAAPIISDWECVQCCFLSILQITHSHQRKSASSWRFHTHRKVEAH